MTRVLLTFETLHKLLAAEKSVNELGKSMPSNKAFCLVRPTPTPPALSKSVCGMSLEILSIDSKQTILKHLKEVELSPDGVHDFES